LIDPEATPFDEPSTLEADGAATATPRRALVIKTADCQPILLAHKDGKHVAALHVGWRGNVLEFPCSGVEAFCRAYDLRPEDVLAVRGPSLGPGAAEFVNFEKEWPERFRPWFDEATRTMHLWELTRAALESVGLRRDNIFGLDLCTQSLPELFFSFRRRDDVRQMSLIWIRE
jgi:YfiH family protein